MADPQKAFSQDRSNSLERKKRTAIKSLAFSLEGIKLELDMLADVSDALPDEDAIKERLKGLQEIIGRAQRDVEDLAIASNVKL